MAEVVVFHHALGPGAELLLHSCGPHSFAEHDEQAAARLIEHVLVFSEAIAA